jgi:hypothetical protein
MTDHAGYQQFLKKHHNVKQPPKSGLERLCETMDYYGKLDPGTTMTRIIKEIAPGAKKKFNYGSMGNANKHDNLRPVHTAPKQIATNRIDDLPLFQKA